MTKLKTVSHLPDVQPWVFTLVHKESLQVTKILALGHSCKIAEIHLRSQFSEDLWQIDSCMRISNKKFLCNADYSFPNCLIDF